MATGTVRMNNARITATTNNRLSGATAKAFRQQRVVLELGR